MQCLQSGLRIRLILFVPLRNLGVQVPAVVIEARLPGEFFDLSTRLLIQMQKSDNNVSHLHSGIVNVVLYVHRAACELKQANERVSENRVTQVADVRGLVRIDARVLDQNLARRGFDGRLVMLG